MRNFSLIFVICIFFYAKASASFLPPDINKCVNADSACLTKSIQHAIRTYAKTGVREMNLVPFDPLHINLLKLDENPSSPVSIALKFSNVDLLGLQNAKVNSVKGLDADIKDVIEIHAVIPKLTLKGPYTINGKVLILPIVGAGHSEIILDETRIDVKFKVHPIQKAGKTHLEIEATKLSLGPKRVHFFLENLFNGNKELGDNMNKFINENWSEIFTELQPDLAEAIGLIIKQLINSVFAKHPYADFFEH